MIKYQLKCAPAGDGDGDGQEGESPVLHEFEGWFSNSEDYERQAERGLLECPVCGSRAISKALMAPAIMRSAGKPAQTGEGEKAREALAEAARRARAYIEKNFDNVGKRFPEEARRIHYGESAERQIYGEATGEEVRELVDEGIEIAPVPAAPASPDEIKKKMN